MYNVAFYGSGETTGSVSKFPKIKNQNSDTSIVETPKQDTLCFRANQKEEVKKGSTITKVIGTLTGIALLVGGLACAHKYDWVGKLSDGKFKDFMRKSDIITEPCHKACAKVKDFSVKYYNKIKDYFNKK